METTEAHHSMTLLDPARTLNAGDPGDRTLRNFRYQLLYGVILLVAASAGKKTLCRCLVRTLRRFSV